MASTGACRQMKQSIPALLICKSVITDEEYEELSYHVKGSANLEIDFLLQVQSQSGKILYAHQTAGKKWSDLQLQIQSNVSCFVC
jgi:hypothetical protein